MKNIYALTILLLCSIVVCAHAHDGEWSSGGLGTEGYIIQQDDVDIEYGPYLNFTGSVNLSSDGTTIDVEVTGGGSGGAGNTFRTWDTPSGTDPVADSTTDTVTFVATSPITITGDSAADSVTFALTTVPLASGGTGQTAATDDTMLLGNGTIWQLKTIPDCGTESTDKIMYTQSTNTWSCGTDQNTGGAGGSIGFQEDGVTLATTTGTLDFDGSDFTIVESPANDFDIVVTDDGHNHGTSSISGIVAADMGDADHGAVSWSSGVATVEDLACTGCVSDSELASTFLKNVVEDTAPQLGGDLDVQTNAIESNTDVTIDIDEDNNGTETFIVRNGADATLLIVNEDGSVGVGGAVPTTDAFHVLATTYILDLNDTASALEYTLNFSGGNFYSNYDNGSLHIATLDAMPIYLKTGNTTRVEIEDDGDVSFMQDIFAGTAQINDSMLSINGMADKIQATIQSYSTQNEDVFVIEQSDGTEVFEIADAGTVTLAGSLTISELSGSPVILAVDSSGSVVGTVVAGGAETNSLETTITGIADTEIFIGDGANSGTFASISGGATMTNAGVVTLNEKFSWTIRPQQAKLPTSNAMAIDAGGNQWKGLFDDTTDECARWSSILTPYNGGTLAAELVYSLETTSSSDVVEFELSIMCISGGDSADVDTDSFGTVDNLSSGSVSTTAGYPVKLSDASLNGDSCAEGDLIVVKVCRDADDTDTTADDVEKRIGVIYEL